MNPTLNLYFVETRDEIIQNLKERKRKDKKKNRPSQAEPLLY